MKTKSLLGAIRAFIREYDEAERAARDLWTRLPSRAATVRHHLDAVDKLTPSPARIMQEARAAIDVLLGASPIAEADRSLFRCACGDEHDSRQLDLFTEVRIVVKS